MNFTLLFTILVFLGTYVWLATEKTPRYVVALCGAALLILGKVFTLEEAMGHVNWETIGLIFGMFTIVEALSQSGFFNWLSLHVAKTLNYNPVKVFFAFPLLAAFLSMFLDDITVMVFLSTLTLQLCKYIPINPLVLISAEVCAANTGGGATLVGAPPNVVMGNQMGYGFNDFVIHTGPVVWVCTFVLLAVYFVFYRKELVRVRVHDRETLEKMDPKDEVKDRPLMMGGLAAAGVAIFLLITHRFLEHQLGLPITVAMASLIPALALMAYKGIHGRDVMKKIDLESLVFFIGLFIIVGGLEKSGAFKIFSGWILSMVQDPLAVALIFLWFAAFASAVVDNVPMALSMAYLIKSITAGPDAPPQGILVWASVLGLLMGGNMTPIGASPNVVAYSIMEKHKIKLGWWPWMKLTVPPTLLALTVASLFIVFKYRLGWF